MQHQLVMDRGETRAAVGEDVVTGLDGDDVQQRPRAFQVREELVTEADALRRTFEQPRHVGDGQLRPVVGLDGPELGLDRGERVVGDLRARVRDAVQER